MNQRTPQQITAVSLALCLFLASSLLTAIAAKHGTHSGHDQSTHQQTWCGWLCAAGQAVHAPSLGPAQAFALIAKTEPFLPQHTVSIPSAPPQSRAPPTTHS